MTQLAELEEQIVSCLSDDVRLLNDLPTTKKLAELKKQLEETQERYMTNAHFLTTKIAFIANSVKYSK